MIYLHAHATVTRTKNLNDYTIIHWCLQTAYPLRIHQVHILNMPSYAQSMVNMVLGILKKKIASRVSAGSSDRHNNTTYSFVTI